VTRVIEIPTQFDDRSFDVFARSYDAASAGDTAREQAIKDVSELAAPTLPVSQTSKSASAVSERVLFDAHATQWSSPYGLVALLAAGHALVEHGGERPLFTIPADRQVSSYWARAGFFDQAAAYFEIHGKVPRVQHAAGSDVLLEVTPVRGADDVHSVVNLIQERAAAILASELQLEAQATMGFAMALS
jgi:hypothetical protein